MNEYNDKAYEAIEERERKDTTVFQRWVLIAILLFLAAGVWIGVIILDNIAQNFTTFMLTRPRVVLTDVNP